MGYVAVHRAAEPQVEEVLRAAVRSSRGGILVRSDRDLGGFVVVQPCDDERRPTRPALRIGPVRSRADATALADWLTRGAGEPRELPAHLLGLGSIN